MSVFPQSLIYAFALPDREDVVKIGKTQESLTGRLQDAHSFHPLGVDFLAAWHFPDHKQLRDAESLIKKTLPRYRSEWFRLDRSRAVGAIEDVLGRSADFGTNALGKLISSLEPYDNLSGKRVSYKDKKLGIAQPLMLRVWLHQRQDQGQTKEVKLSRNPWRRPPNAQVSSTAYRNGGALTYAPDPLLPLAVYEFDLDDTHGFVTNNAQVFALYDEFCRDWGFDVPRHLKVGWTPRTFGDVTDWLASQGMQKRPAYGAPMLGEHPKQ